MSGTVVPARPSLCLLSAHSVVYLSQVGIRLYLLSLVSLFELHDAAVADMAVPAPSRLIACTRRCVLRLLDTAVSALLVAL